MKTLAPITAFILTTAPIALYSACGGLTEDIAPTIPDAEPRDHAEGPHDALRADATEPRDASSDGRAMSDARPDARADARADADQVTDASTSELAEIRGLRDFDFDGDTLVYRRAGVDLFTCTMPGCTSGTRLGTAWAAEHFSLSSGNVYYAGFGGAPGSIAVYSAPVAGGAPTLVRQGITERTDVFNLFGGEANLTASVEEFGEAPIVWSIPAPRTASVGTPTLRRHENFGAVITFSHRASNVVVTDVAVPPAGSNGGVATSPRMVAGSPVPHPAVAVITNGYERVCPTRVACTEWLHFQRPSTLTTVVGFDATYFYLGDHLGLRRCPLAEIDTLRTCTFTDLAAEPVDYPFYVVPNTSGDATAIWYRSGDRVRKLTLP